MAKMTLLIYLPTLFTSPSDYFSENIRAKLLVAAIEVAEHNHALNAEQACRHWRWVYQTYTHWHAVVYLLIEICRRPWSSNIERAWVALHSQWLIPAQSHIDKNLRVWIPLRKLMAKARKHRTDEIERLSNDLEAAERLKLEDEKMPIPTSTGPFPAGNNVAEIFGLRWRQLLHSSCTTQGDTNSLSAYDIRDSATSASANPASIDVCGSQTLQRDPFADEQNGVTPNAIQDIAMGQTFESFFSSAPTIPPTWSTGLGFVPQLWTDTDSTTDTSNLTALAAYDVNMDFNGEIDWYSWLEDAKGIECNAGPIGDRVV